MESKLVDMGFIEFNVFGKPGPFIKIGVGYITFIKEREEFTYRFNDIKKIYTKGSDLFIEHKNFEKCFSFLSQATQIKFRLPIFVIGSSFLRQWNFF